MVEIIDVNSKLKLMAMIVLSVDYNGSKYIVYCVDRGEGKANIFVSKLVINSEGLVFNHEFENGEKEVLDSLIKKIINKEDIEKDGFKFNNSYKLGDINYFDMDKCYVSTIDKKVIKDIMIYYKLVTEKTFERPVVEVIEDKGWFNLGFVANMFFILFGIAVILFCIVMVVRFFL